MKFPLKLWNIVNECSTGAIGWGPYEDSFILDKTKFKEEYLFSDDIFKTTKFQSFVRQLNLYGFSKCNRYNFKIQEYKHPYFVKDHPHLLANIERRSGTGSLKLRSLNLKVQKSKPIRKAHIQLLTPLKHDADGVQKMEVKVKSEIPDAVSPDSSQNASSPKTPPKQTPDPHPTQNIWWNSFPHQFMYPVPGTNGAYCYPEGWVPPAWMSYYNIQPSKERIFNVNPQEYPFAANPMYWMMPSSAQYAYQSLYEDSTVGSVQGNGYSYAPGSCRRHNRSGNVPEEGTSGEN